MLRCAYCGKEITEGEEFTQKEKLKTKWAARLLHRNFGIDFSGEERPFEGRSRTRAETAHWCMT